MRRIASRCGWTPRPRGGQALVEFAFVLPILLLLILGIFEFGRAYNAYEVVTDVAREAARRAVVDDTSSTATIRGVAVADLDRAGLAAADSMVTVSDPNTAGATTTVTIQYPFKFLFLGPMLSWATGQDQVVLSSTCEMRHE